MRKEEKKLKCNVKSDINHENYSMYFKVHINELYLILKDIQIDLYTLFNPFTSVRLNYIRQKFIIYSR